MPNTISWNKRNRILHTCRKNIYVNMKNFILFDTHFSIAILKDNKRTYWWTICYEESTFGSRTVLFPEITLVGNILVTSEGYKISINFRMSELSVAYSQTQHSKWQLWFNDDYLSGTLLTSLPIGQRCSENPAEADVSLWKSPPLALNSRPLF
jgi:hypothetical protein